MKRTTMARKAKETDRDRDRRRLQRTHTNPLDNGSIDRSSKRQQQSKLGFGLDIENLLGNTVGIFIYVRFIISTKYYLNQWWVYDLVYIESEAVHPSLRTF